MKRASRVWTLSGWLSAALAALALALASLPAAGLDPQAMRAAAQRLGAGAVSAVEPTTAMIGQLARMDERARLDAANRFINLRIEFRPDSEVWGQDDYWATPLEAFAKGRGDCEDYVIAKYVLLLAAGTPKDRLRLVYVRAQLLDVPQPQPHMVLAYYAQPGAEPLLLDNLRPDVTAASVRPDLSPVFSFNSDGLWQGTGSVTAGDPLARLSRWRDVWTRIRQEGFLP